MNKLKISYTLYTLLVAFIFTSCERNDYMVVIKTSKDKTERCKFFIQTTEYSFRTNKQFIVGDTLYLNKTNCN